jgi:predicted RND superfamily exporter protein
VLPVILTTMALCDEIHLLFRYQRRLAESFSGSAVLDTFRQMARPMVLTGITTAIGFLSLLSSPLAAVRSMGLFAGVGIAGGVLWALTVTAAALTLLGPERLRRRKPVREPAASATGTFPWLRRPVPWLLLLLAVTLIGIAGIFQLRVQDSWIDGFARGSSFRQATDRANERLLGTHILLVQLTWPAPAPKPEAESDDPFAFSYEAPLLHQDGPLLEPAVLAEIGRFEAFLRGQPSVGGVIGPYAELTNAAYLWLGRVEKSRAIPESQERVDLLLDRYELARGLTRRREILDDAMRRAVVTIFLRNANFRDTARLQKAVARYARQRFAPAGVGLDYAGDVAISQSMIPKIVTTQVASLLWTVVGMFVAVLVFWRSPRIALWVLAPVSLGVIWVLGGMGWLSVPLGIATSMFCAIAIGLGDYSVHFLEEIERAREEGHPHPARRSIELTGPSILADTLAIGAGFLLLGFSQVPANARLGLLVASALAASCILTLVGLAALLTWREGWGRTYNPEEKR